MDRSRGLRGWPADRHLNPYLPDHEMRVEQVDKLKEINLYADTSAVRPELFCKGEINYKFKRNREKNHHRTGFNPRLASNRLNNNSRAWKEKSRETMGCGPSEPPNFDPPLKNKKANFPRKTPGLLGDCPVARIPPNAPGGPLLPFPPVYPIFPPQENQMQNPNLYDRTFDEMEPLKNFICTKRDSRQERESGHHYQGNYSQAGKIQGPRHTSDEPYSQYTDPERVEPGSSFMYNNSYNRKEAPKQSQISPPNRNLKGNFRSKPNLYEDELDNSYMRNKVQGPNHVSPEIDNRGFRGNFRAEHSFENQHEGFNNERFQNKKQNNKYPRKSWQGNRKFNRNQKPYYREIINSDVRREENAFFSFHRRPCASPMRVQSNPIRRNRRYY